MAEVIICSLVRDGMTYLPSFKAQLQSLTLAAGDSWKLCILEGDSHDGSREFLEAWSHSDPDRVVIGKEDAGEASNIEDRVTRWARIGNACFDLIPRHGNAHSHVLWLEADLCFPADLLKRLLERKVDIVAPVIWLGGLFYDGWGFRGLDGERWTGKPPYHRDFRPLSLIEVQSVGSCVLFRRAILDAGIRFRGPYENGLLVGMCLDARMKGFRVWADTRTAILHPVSHWEDQLYRCKGMRIANLDGTTSVFDAHQLVEMGYDPALPYVDRDAWAMSLKGMWNKLFRRYPTNRIKATAIVTAGPAKSFFLEIEVMPPQGAGTSQLLRRFMMSRFRVRWSTPAHQRYPPFSMHAAYERFYRCEFQIRSEQP